MRIIIFLGLMACAWVATAYDLTGTWKADDGGTYYLRQSGDRVYWYGEQSATNPDWANVFDGRVTGNNELQGRWVDLPKGRAHGGGELSLRIRQGGNVLEVENVKGSYGASRWERKGHGSSQTTRDRPDKTRSARRKNEGADRHRIPVNPDKPEQRREADRQRIQVQPGGSKHVVIQGKGHPGGTKYRIAVSGELEQVDGEAGGFPVTIQNDDNVGSGPARSVARGAVKQGNDGFRYTGELKRINLANRQAAKVWINGEPRAAPDRNVYLKTSSGLCLTVNPYDLKLTRGERAKRRLKKTAKMVFDPTEHIEALANLHKELALGPGGVDMVESVVTIRNASDIDRAWQGDLRHGLGVTLMECGAVDAKFQRVDRDGRFVRMQAEKDLCIKGKRGQQHDNGGRVQLGKCKSHERAGWRFPGKAMHNEAGKCLDVHAPQLSDEGARVQLWKCNGARQQRWQFASR